MMPILEEKQHSDFSYVYCKAGRKVAHLKLSLANQAIFIDDIHVFKEFRRCGIATAIMQKWKLRFPDSSIEGYALNLELAKFWRSFAHGYSNIPECSDTELEQWVYADGLFRISMKVLTK